MTVVALIVAGWLVAAVGVALVFCRAARLGSGRGGPWQEGAGDLPSVRGSFGRRDAA